jgi:hypothetical protein
MRVRFSWAHGVTGLLVALAASASSSCSSDSDGSKQDISKAGAASGGAGQTSGGSSASGGTSGKAGSAAGGASGSGGTDTQNMSKECRDYCACFDQFCSDIQTIPSGLSCPDFCATFSAKQWDCRISHCKLVVPEKNPGHCEHAVGIDQCL